MFFHADWLYCWLAGGLYQVAVYCIITIQSLDSTNPAVMWHGGMLAFIGAAA